MPRMGGVLPAYPHHVIQRGYNRATPRHGASLAFCLPVPLSNSPAHPRLLQARAGK